MNILVTGGNGYKGSVLIPLLLKDGHNILSVDTNWFGNYLNEHENLRLVIDDIRKPKFEWFENIQVVIHLANIANDPAVELNPLLSWETNVLSMELMLSKAKSAGVKSFIFASSGSVYGLSNLPKVTEDTELIPISEYNKTKMIAERILLSYSNDMKVFGIRPATVCGVSPRMRLDVAVNILTYKALSEKKITVYGGNQIRPNIHIDDICQCYIHFLNNYKILENGFYNAGFENISIIDIAKKVKQKLPESKIVVSESNDPRSYRQCSDKLLATGFKPKKDVSAAIDEIISAYKSNNLNMDPTCFSVKHLKSISII